MAKNKKQILEGSRAIALTVKNIAPTVVSAYPITPQTHIVEDLAQFKADGRTKYEYVRAESEFAAASIVLGASAGGARVYSATSSQGLLLMTEVLYNIAGLRLPVVMTCANRAVSSPINIWCDHSDVMAVRDAGWIQLFAADSQEAVAQHLLAYKLAEKLRLPVMVNVDGFIITHSYESVIIPDAALIKKYLPPYRPAKDEYLNPAAPATFGAFFTPEYYMETREDLHRDLRTALSIIKKEYKNAQRIIGREIMGADDGLTEYYGSKNPETILVAMGSMIGTIRETIKDQKKVGVLNIKVYRPFPGEEIIKALGRAKNIAVLEKALSLGQAGPLYSDLKAALVCNAKSEKSRVAKFNIKNYVVGLGGRDVTGKIILDIIADVNRRSGKPSENAIKFVGK